MPDDRANDTMIRELLAQNYAILTPETHVEEEEVEAQEVVTQDMITEVQGELDLLRKQRLEVERAAREFEESTAKEEEGLKGEIQRVSNSIFFFFSSFLSMNSLPFNFFFCAYFSSRRERKETNGSS